MTSKLVLILIVFGQIPGAGCSQAQSPKIIGSWKMGVAFGNAENRSFRFEARESGEGSFLLLDPRWNVWGSHESSKGKWAVNDAGSVTFSGAVEFPLGNVGREGGTLVLKGKLGTDGAITGEAIFFPADQDPKDPKAKASKSGTFKAIRVTGS